MTVGRLYLCAMIGAGNASITKTKRHNMTIDRFITEANKTTQLSAVACDCHNDRGSVAVEWDFCPKCGKAAITQKSEVCVELFISGTNRVMIVSLEDLRLWLRVPNARLERKELVSNASFDV